MAKPTKNKRNPYTGRTTMGRPTMVRTTMEE
jgi:hypothetical protein